MICGRIYSHTQENSIRELDSITVSVGQTQLLSPCHTVEIISPLTNCSIQLIEKMDDFSGATGRCHGTSRDSASI
jgi:hypothetical protein